jgi:arylsulfatase A-like enzyme
MPTLISAAGGSLEGILLDGVDQWQALQENETSRRREALLQYDEEKHIYAVRRDNWKIVNGKL